MRKSYPKCWKYLSSWKDELIKRDNGDLDNNQWYRFSRSQSLDKLGAPKLVAAGTVPSLRFSFDEVGDTFLTGGRVDGVVPAKDINQWFLLATLNGDVDDFVFRRVGRPKQGGWFEANKQFIAPLPIPYADKKQQAEIGKRARDLQKSWTKRRDLFEEANARLSTMARATNKARFLWPDLPDIEALKQQAPKSMTMATEKNKWSKEKFEELEEARIETLQGFLDAGLPLTVSFAKGELSMTSEGRVVFNKIYLDAKDGKLADVYWRFLILGQPKDAKGFARDLARIPSGPETPAAKQFAQRVEALIEATDKIRTMETEMNEMLYDLYKLSADERTLIEKDCAKRRLL